MNKWILAAVTLGVVLLFSTLQIPAAHAIPENVFVITQPADTVSPWTDFQLSAEELTADTADLIDRMLEQGLWWKCAVFSSSVLDEDVYRAFYQDFNLVREIAQRPDAAELLFDKLMDRKAELDAEKAAADMDDCFYVLRAIVSQKEFCNQLSSEQQSLLQELLKDRTFRLSNRFSPAGGNVCTP